MSFISTITNKIFTKNKINNILNKGPSQDGSITTKLQHHPHLYLSQRAREAADAVGDVGAGEGEEGEGGRKAGAGLWIGPGLTEQTGWILVGRASQLPRPQRWLGRSPG